MKYMLMLAGIFLFSQLSAQIITTVAGGATGHGGYYGDGGQATAAELYGPVGLALDSRGNLFIGDAFSYRVRKVDFTSGIISTYAGTGTAGFFGDGGPATLAKISGASFLALDSADNLYVSDPNNFRIRNIK